MKKVIHNLREKSPQQKKLITFTVSASLTGLIFIVWLSAFVTSLNTSNDDNVVKVDTPFDTVKNQAGVIFSR